MNARRGSKFSLGMLITAGAWLSVGEVTVQGHPGLHHDIERISAELAQAPDCCESLIERGYLYRLNGDLSASLADLDRAQELDPSNRDVALQRGLTLAALGRDAEAARELDRILNIGPVSTAALAVRGDIAARSGLHEEAISYYTAAIALKPDVELILARGKLQESQGRPADAAQGYREGLQLCNGALVIRLALISVETARKEYEAANRLVDEELARVPVKGEWLLRRSDIYFAAGNLEQARRDREAALHEADRVLAARPTAVHYLTRARIHRAMGNSQAAERDLQSALAKSPRFADARNLLHELQVERDVSKAGE